jgi:hypothetical protein
MHTASDTLSLTSMLIALVVMNLLFMQQVLTYVF